LQLQWRKRRLPLPAGVCSSCCILCCTCCLTVKALQPCWILQELLLLVLLLCCCNLPQLI
jgi:hypothetical protein